MNEVKIMMKNFGQFHNFMSSSFVTTRVFTNNRSYSPSLVGKKACDFIEASTANPFPERDRACGSLTVETTENYNTGIEL